jgi:hypothetical protein
MGKELLPGVWGKKLVRFSPTKFWHHTHTSVVIVAVVVGLLAYPTVVIEERGVRTEV